MVSNGFRRIPIISGNTVLGMLTTVDLVRYIGEGSAFRRTLLDEMDQVMSLPVSEIMRTGVITVKSDLQIGEVAPLIRTSGVGAVLVEDGGDLAGILTERDLLTALAIE
jgi:CBS domain-containing protein